MVKKHAFILVTLIGWAITTYTLYFTQHKVYGNAIKTIWFYVLIFVPLLFIFNFSSEDKENKPQNKKNNKMDIICQGLVCIIIIYCIATTPYEARMWNIVWVAVISLVLFIFKPLKEKLKDSNYIKERCAFVILTFTFLIVEPFAFAAITGADTVNIVKNRLIAEGYSNISYKGTVRDLRYIDYLFKSDVKLEDSKELSLGAYIFAKKDSASETALCVSVTSGRTLASIEVEKGSKIDFYLYN